MPFFRYAEPRYYFFGLQAGTRNLLENGVRLGVRKTIGKITQPINWYSRFPEYYFFDEAIRDHLRTLPDGVARILDVGSPKTLGLYLASTAPAELTLTDISPSALDEYARMWACLERRAAGRALFSTHDARALQLPDSAFDAVYSMSVIEHVEGESGDSRAVRELIRVLKPGGVLILSVPLGPVYMEQQIRGRAGSAGVTPDRGLHFFQRIYDRSAFQSRIVAPAGDLDRLTCTSVWRRRAWMHRAFATLGENVRGALGFLHPILSACMNQSAPGLGGSAYADYGQTHSARDVYGDVILSGRKRAA